jgi:hypothetical protein
MDTAHVGLGAYDEERGSGNTTDVPGVQSRTRYITTWCVRCCKVHCLGRLTIGQITNFGNGLALASGTWCVIFTLIAWTSH